MTPAPLPLGDASATRLSRVVAWALALMAAVHFLQWTILQPDDVQAALGFRRGDLEVGRWWSILTFPFVHADLSSLLISSFTLAVFGSRLEREWGSRRFLAFEHDGPNVRVQGRCAALSRSVPCNEVLAAFSVTSSASSSAILLPTCRAVESINSMNLGSIPSENRV